MVVTLFFLGFLFEFISSSYPRISGILSVTLLFIYITGFEMGIGSLFWPLLTETFPAEFVECHPMEPKYITGSFIPFFGKNFITRCSILVICSSWFIMYTVVIDIRFKVHRINTSKSSINNKLGFKEEARNERNYIYVQVLEKQ